MTLNSDKAMDHSFVAGHGEYLLEKEWQTLSRLENNEFPYNFHPRNLFS
jgi:hypothetical protein